MTSEQSAIHTAPMAIRRAIASDLPALHELVARAFRGESAKAGWTHEADLLGGQRVDREGLQAILDDRDNEAILCAGLRADLAADGAGPGRGGGLIGCVRVSRAGPRGLDDDSGLPAPVAGLGMLAVDPLCQAAGLGKQLVAAAEAFAMRHYDAQTMTMSVIAQRPELIAFYERRNYRDTGSRAPFPSHDPRFGIPRRDDLVFVILAKQLRGPPTLATPPAG